MFSVLVAVTLSFLVLCHFSVLATDLNQGNVDTLMCRFCRDNDDIIDSLREPSLTPLVNKWVTPCACKGSLAFIHATCLARQWSMTHPTDPCTVCLSPFNLEEHEDIVIAASRLNEPSNVFEMRLFDSLLLTLAYYGGQELLHFPWKEFTLDASILLMRNTLAMLFLQDVSYMSHAVKTVLMMATSVVLEYSVGHDPFPFQPFIKPFSSCIVAMILNIGNTNLLRFLAHVFITISVAIVPHIASFIVLYRSQFRTRSSGYSFYTAVECVLYGFVFPLLLNAVVLVLLGTRKNLFAGMIAPEQVLLLPVAIPNK